MLFCAVVNSVGQARRWFGHSDPNELSLFQLALCGAWAGFVNCAVVGPIELVKTQMQQQLTFNTQTKFKSALRFFFLTRLRFF